MLNPIYSIVYFLSWESFRLLRVTQYETKNLLNRIFKYQKFERLAIHELLQLLLS
jgi:hypothetical protein